MEQQTKKTNSIETGIYEHYRGGRYEVLGEALSSEDPAERFVIYKSLEPAHLSEDNTFLPAGTLWARPASMFKESFVDKDGQTVQRFRKVA